MKLERRLRSRILTMALTLLLAIAGTAHAQQVVIADPNRIPLTFGMNAEQASFALGVPLRYVRGSPGDELLLAVPNVKGMTLAYRSEGLYLQFLRGRLTGWKGDWGTIRP